MEDTSTPRVLDVGQCDLDHGSIGRMLGDRFSARVDRAHSVDEALAAIRSTSYDLVLINRVLDRDGAEGTVLVERMQADDRIRGTPVMLVSNYREAQDGAVARGARRGFGKSDIDGSDTIELLSEFLVRPREARTGPGRPGGR